jgi:hypothetical protein
MRERVKAVRRSRVLLVALGVFSASALLLPGCNRAIQWAMSKREFDSVPPALPSDLRAPALLLFSKTNGFRHDSIPAAVTALGALAAERGWSVFHTENGAVHRPELLARFAAVVWVSASGDNLTDEQEDALRRYVEGGGGFLGLHGTGGDFYYSWSWIPGELLRAQFIGHPMNPQFQEATLVVEDPAHPATRELPERWQHTEEWYSFERSPRDRVHVLARVEESSYVPEIRGLWLLDRDLRMGDDHPVVWCHCNGQGRVLYSALGHRDEAYADASYRSLLAGAMGWVAGLEGPGCAELGSE